ncbi:unnamed protein product [Adineta ricciae]|uniref:Uncharacterized protein n=1 Tax=Adineta ricciae TaxID=249248 RepID=A0A815YD26_ADIRI|nr:unnamed protein product [Adineta ricciae]
MVTAIFNIDRMEKTLMSTITKKSLDGLSVPTVLCIGVHDATSHTIGSVVNISINQKLGCRTHPVITSVCTGQNEINLPTSVISCQLQPLRQMLIDSINIDAVGCVESVEEIREFLRNLDSKKSPVVLNLNNEARLNDDVLQATIDSILPFCSVVIITHDVIKCLRSNEQQSMQNVASKLLTMGPEAIVVQDENGQRYVVINDNNERSQSSYSLLPTRSHNSYTEDLSAAIAAFLAHGNLTLSTAIAYGDSYSTARELHQLPDVRILPYTFVQEMWSFVDDIHKRILTLPFINKMLDSTLNERIHDYYIIQDYYFFLDRGYMLNGLVNHCIHDTEVLEFLKTQLEKNKKYINTILVDNNLPPCDENTIEKMPACVYYTRMMRELGEHRGILATIAGLVGLLPCTLIYAKVGDWMIESGIRPTIKRYADFIDAYYDQARHDRLAHFIELINRLANNCSHEQKLKLKEIFRQICEYEYAFWDDAYQYGMHY